jgi:hypothetical protein
MNDRAASPAFLFLYVESGASCGVFIIPRMRDKKGKDRLVMGDPFFSQRPGTTYGSIRVKKSRWMAGVA